MKFLTLVLMVVSSTAMANSNDLTLMPTCMVSDFYSAANCMKSVALAYDEYEQPNAGVASVRKDTLVKVLAAVKANAKTIATAANSDFVGIVLEYGDETHLRYIGMKKGSAKPVEIYDLNLVDLEYDLVAVLKVNDLFLNLNIKKTDWAYSDAVESLAYALAHKKF